MAVEKNNKNNSGFILCDKIYTIGNMVGIGN